MVAGFLVYASMYTLSLVILCGGGFREFIEVILDAFLRTMTWFVYPYLFARPFSQSMIARIFNLHRTDYTRSYPYISEIDLKKKEEDIH